VKRIVSGLAIVLVTTLMLTPVYGQQQAPKGTEGPDVRKVEPKGTEGPDVRKTKPKKKTASSTAPRPKVEPKGTEGPGIRKVEPKGTEGPDVRKTKP
jgi:hypothetical protein